MASWVWVQLFEDKRQTDGRRIRKKLRKCKKAKKAKGNGKTTGNERREVEILQWLVYTRRTEASERA